jgi:Family of unknown function (DUF5640)
MKKFFGFGSSTPAPPPPPSRPPAPPTAKPGAPKSATTVPAIVGRWKEPSGSDTTEFHADGTVVEKPASGETIRGRYQLEGAKLTIKLERVLEPLVFTATIKNDALEMKDPEGQVTQYRRV